MADWRRPPPPEPRHTCRRRSPAQSRKHARQARGRTRAPQCPAFDNIGDTRNPDSPLDADKPGPAHFGNSSNAVSASRMMPRAESDTANVFGLYFSHSALKKHSGMDRPAQSRCICAFDDYPVVSRKTRGKVGDVDDWQAGSDNTLRCDVSSLEQQFDLGALCHQTGRSSARPSGSGQSASQARRGRRGSRTATDRLSRLRAVSSSCNDS